jgi:hypothetical protein
MNGSFVFVSHKTTYHVPFKMEPIGEKVEVVLDTANISPKTHSTRDINMHVSGLLNGKHFPNFHVTPGEFEHFKDHIVNKRVKWSVAPDPRAQRDPPVSIIDRFNRTVEKLTRSSPPLTVEINGAWIANQQSAGGKKRSKKRISKKRSGKSRRH